jgi:hypothetical protein
MQLQDSNIPFQSRGNHKLHFLHAICRIRLLLQVPPICLPFLLQLKCPTMHLHMDSCHLLRSYVSVVLWHIRLQALLFPFPLSDLVPMVFLLVLTLLPLVLFLFCLSHQYHQCHPSQWKGTLLGHIHPPIRDYQLHHLRSPRHWPGEASE